MAWGLFPLVFAAAGMNLAQVGLLAAIYPATWGVAQLATGALSDRTGRKPLIVWGMWIQAAGIGVVTMAHAFAGFVIGAVLLGIGTAMVYPTLLAAIGDVAHPSWRASAVGVYRLWRDLGYAIGALLAGVTADAFGLNVAMWVIAALTFVSGVVSATRMAETLPAERDGDRRPTVTDGSPDRNHTSPSTRTGRSDGMPKTLFILNDPPYGTERSYNALRLAGSLSKRDGEEVKVFLIGDAASCAKKDQKVPQGYYNTEVMLRNVGRHGGEIGVCATCMDARGIADAELTDTTHRSSLEELTNWVQWADRTLRVLGEGRGLRG